MTLPYSPSRAVYAGNGTATVFPFAFKVWSEEQLVVSVTSPQGVTSVAQGWSAALNESGGAVTYLHEGAPLPEGWRLAIVRDMPFGQDIDLVSATRFDAQVIEDGLDQACAERQQLREQLARAVIMPPTSETTPEEVVQSVYDARDAAAASATAASGSASEASGSAALAQTWAESPTPPDAGDADSRSARTWAGLAAGSADAAAASESNAAAGADRARAWAESPAPPDPEDPDSKSAKSWAAIAADTVPIATPTLAGKVKPDGATIEVAQDGGISVPAATTTDLGLARLATPAEVRAGAAAAGSVTPAVLRPEDISSFHAVLTGEILFQKIFQSSGSFSDTVDRHVRMTIVAGGGSGGNGSNDVYGASNSAGLGGRKGGNSKVTIPAGATLDGVLLTSSRTLTVNGGAAGNGGGRYGGGGGGEAGNFEEHELILPAGLALTFTIGAGGEPYTSGTMSSTVGGIGEGNPCQTGAPEGWGGASGPGGTDGICGNMPNTRFGGGDGGRKHPQFGGGGPGGPRHYAANGDMRLYPVRGGRPGPGAGEASVITARANPPEQYSRGGRGGDGALILEYWNRYAA